MRKNVFRLVKQLMPILLIGLVLPSCKDMLEVEPEDTLSREQTYRNIYDADAAVIGIYGKLQGIAQQYVLLNELRADLMDVTPNADAYLIQLNLHNVSADNPYTNPRPFYELILDCNDVLSNFDRMLQENKLEPVEYNQRYSDIGALRSWLYLQLAIHYGEIPYVTDPLEKVEDIQDASKFPILTFEQVLDELIAFTEALPHKVPYQSSSSLNTFVDGYPTTKFFINKQALLGDLHLWKGNYLTAATYYKGIMNVPGNDFKTNRISFGDLTVGYTRFWEQDINSLINSNDLGWRSMFALPPTSAAFNQEWIWILPYDKNFSPRYPFIDLFSNVGGKYLVQPSQQAIANWNSQVQTNTFPFDVRGMFSYQRINGQPVIMKYLYNYNPANPLEKSGKWFLNRAATIHLRFAEAANRDTRHKLAWALLNQGIKGTFDSNPAVVDQTNKQATFDAPPYDFNARQGDFPHYRDPWHQNIGIRGRANLQPIPAPPAADSLLYIENNLINEAGLELAFEGHRWPDLVRIAMRRNEPAFLADRVYAKLQKAGYPEAAAVREKLMNRSNWFLPFRLK